jgi:chromosome segregation ATPase
MDGSLSQNWFGLHDQPDNGKSVYGVEAISNAELNRKLSEIAVAFAMELQTAQTELQAAQAELQTGRSELQATQSGLQAAQAELRAYQLELQAAQVELQHGRSELHATQSELQVAQSELYRVYRTRAWRMRKFVMVCRDRIRQSIFHRN